MNKGLYQISNGGGTNAKWSRDGRAIYYANLNFELVRVSVNSGATFTTGDRKVLFPLRGVADWDVAPDGRFIMLRGRGQQQRSKLVTVENFFQELNTKVPK